MTAPGINRLRLRRAIVLALFLLTVAALAYMIVTRASALGLPTNDYVQYWAAGRLNLRGLNPYDPQQMLALQKSVGWPLDFPVMPYYPPWVVAIFMPMGLPSYPASRVLWLVLSLALLLGCAGWLWRFYGGPRGRSIWALAAAGFYAPIILTLEEGQVTPLILLGLVGFLWFGGRRRWLVAGACAALAAIKPQLLVLFWLALLVWAIDRRRWTVLLGAILVWVGALLVALIPNPPLLSDYVYYLTHYHSPATSDTATLATILRLLFGEDRLWLTWVPLTLGLIWFSFNWRKQRTSWVWAEQLPVLLFASVISAPYAWMHDGVVLLVAVVQAAVLLAFLGQKRAAAIAIAVYLALNGIALALLPTLHYNQPWYTWLPIVVLLWYLGVRRAVSRANRTLGPAPQ